MEAWEDADLHQKLKQHTKLTTLLVCDCRPGVPCHGEVLALLIWAMRQDKWQLGHRADEVRQWKVALKQPAVAARPPNGPHQEKRAKGAKGKGKNKGKNKGDKGKGPGQCQL